MMPSHDRAAGTFADTFSKTEREYAYWVLLGLVPLTYLIITRQSLFNAFEDCGIVLARALQSVYGLGCLTVLCIAMCRVSKKGRRAVWYGYGLFSFLLLIYLLDYFVFPDDLIPIEITSDWTLFNETTGYTKNWTANGTAVGNETDKEARRDAFQRYEAEGEQDFDNAASAFGFGLRPVLLILGFSFALYFFKVDSDKAIVATVIILGIGTLLSLQAWLAHRHVTTSSATSVTNLTQAANATHADALARAVKPNFLPATWVQQAAGTGTDRFRGGPLERLRGVEAQLDELLLRTDATSAAIGHTN